MASVKWCDRGLVVAPLYFTIATSPKHLKSILKNLNWSGGHIEEPQKDAAKVQFLNSKNNKTIALVLIYDHSKDLTSTLALIVHESVHVWQEIRSMMGEQSPSKEFEAYSIQAISQQLMTEYLRQTKRKL